MPVGKAAELAGTNPDYSIQDLYESIATGNFVSEATHFFNVYDNVCLTAIMDSLNSSDDIRTSREVQLQSF